MPDLWKAVGKQEDTDADFVEDIRAYPAGNTVTVKMKLLRLTRSTDSSRLYADASNGRQWWPMAIQRAVILPKRCRAIVTEIDSYAFLRPMVQLMECRCGNGKLMFSTVCLQELQQHPEARALLHSTISFAFGWSLLFHVWERRLCFFVGNNGVTTDIVAIKSFQVKKLIFLP